MTNQEAAESLMGFSRELEGIAKRIRDEESGEAGFPIGALADTFARLCLTIGVTPDESLAMVSDCLKTAELCR